MTEEDYRLVAYSILLLICALCYYKFHMSWLKNINKKRDAFVEIYIYSKIVIDWFIIVSFAIASIVYFLKALDIIEKWIIMYEKYRWILAPAIFIFIGIIMKVSNNKKQFGWILEYKKYWSILVIGGFILFLLKLYLFLK